MIRLGQNFRSISKIKLQSFNSYKFGNNILNGNNINNIRINEYSHDLKPILDIGRAKTLESFIPAFMESIKEKKEEKLEKDEEEEEKEHLEYSNKLKENLQKLKELEASFIEDLAKLNKARTVAQNYLLDKESVIEDDINWEDQIEGLDEKEQNLRKMQTLLEFEAIEDAVNRYRELMLDCEGKSFVTQFGSVRDVLLQWNEGLVQKVEKDLASKDQSSTWVTILKAVSLEKSLLKALNIVVGRSVINFKVDFSLDNIIETIGVSVYAEYKSILLKKTEPSSHKRISKLIPTSALKKFYTISINNPHLVVLPPEPSVIKTIGQFLVSQVFEHCKIQENLGEDGSKLVPSFTLQSHFFRGIRGSRIIPHANIFKLIESGHEIKETGAARLYPMVIKPLPWISPYDGPYLHYKVPLMRTSGSAMQMRSLTDVDLSLIYRSLNILGETPWVINKELYKILSEVYNSGMGIGDIPRGTDYEYPPIPEDLIYNHETRKQFHRKEQKIKLLNSNLHSMRCDVSLKLGVARKFLDNTIYFPHNVDFRGRSYPIPPHLNHLGSDFCRSLLKFEKSLPLGEKGFTWLKIHLANLYGVDKVPLNERIDFTERNMENIFESADNPLDGSRWWLKAENPWQTLSACMEITNAIRSGNPTEFSSNLPIHQDGTCNGLQHYAALGGDIAGAEKVNLIPSDRPQDVYSGVAALVSNLVDIDAKEGNKYAKFFAGNVDRKLVKQTVMTSVYGVTFIGAREQISDAMLEKFRSREEMYDEDFVFNASAYIAKHTFSSLNDMFEGARALMKWMSDCAILIAKSGHCVSWLTPLGLPIVQPYKKGGKYSIRTLECDFLVAHDDDMLPVDTNRQRSAFPPNFIHSLDSTHMFLTALACNEKGITYSSVHDSYWTHACSIDDMNDILRNEFIELHKQPLLDRLLDWFKVRYPDIKFPPLPPKGKLDINKVKESRYFFH
ncbi:hypothetical protein ACTA71_011641 [Dictyostelium dimigraforme]